MQQFFTLAKSFKDLILYYLIILLPYYFIVKYVLLVSLYVHQTKCQATALNRSIPFVLCIPLRHIRRAHKMRCVTGIPCPHFFRFQNC
jgi:hypothetical protein